MKKAKFVVRPSSLAACTILAGDLPAGHLLYRVVLRFKHFKPWKDKQGLAAVILTRAEWMVDTSLTRHQYDRAVKILKDRKLITVRHEKMRKTDQFQRTWIYLAEHVTSAISDITAGDAISFQPESTGKPNSAKSELVFDLFSATADDKENEEQKDNEEEKSNVYQQTYIGADAPEEEVRVADKKEAIEDFLNAKGLPKDVEKAVAEFCCYMGFIGYPVPFPDKFFVSDFEQCINALSLSDYRLFSAGEIAEDPTDTEFTSISYDLRALQIIVSHWEDFNFFLKFANGAWNVPLVPTIGFLKMQASNIVAFFHFQEWVYGVSQGYSHLLFSPSNYADDNHATFDAYRTDDAQFKQLSNHALGKRVKGVIAKHGSRPALFQFSRS
ncbi:MAG: hypothetical protein DI586_05295 [Micavibrio aeruginosavorus]|uniref:Uncharacterized protein n=1 Tax=Micavibrio aeruginosavorus TaxID=349221 RepID=A0A2W5FIX1_9BACT|nr:MAG: hypothetical protein DI586_05295 [Micavibrio aeruginosavorus]